jgi:hypothetical protein
MGKYSQQWYLHQLRKAMLLLKWSPPAGILFLLDERAPPQRCFMEQCNAYLPFFNNWPASAIAGRRSLGAFSLEFLCCDKTIISSKQQIL